MSYICTVECALAFIILSFKATMGGQWYSFSFKKSKRGGQCLVIYMGHPGGKWQNLAFWFLGPSFKFPNCINKGQRAVNGASPSLHGSVMPK